MSKPFKPLDPGRIVKEGYHQDGGARGLYLQVRRQAVSGELTRSWVFRFKLHGKARGMGLGPLGTIGLADARDLAREARKLLLAGIDPIEARQSHKASLRVAAALSITFAECAERYAAAHRAGWSAKHAKDWSNSLATHVNPLLGNLPVAAITTALVVKVLGPIWNTNTVTAGRVRARIEAVLDWATVSEFRTGENPARWSGHLEHKLARPGAIHKVEHYVAMPYKDLPAFMADLRRQDGTAARALEFTILTAGRSDQVMSAPWYEVDLDAKLWHIPENRMKKRRELKVPLSDAAIAILEQMAVLRSGDLVFPGTQAGKPLYEKSLRRVLDSLSRDDIDVHGFRSSFRDWCAEMGVRRELAEAALAHNDKTTTEAAYNRTALVEQRRPVMEAWASWCDGVVAGDNVVALRA